jgi:hypothetical protein
MPSATDPVEVRAIAKEAYIYGFPMVDGYRVQYTYFQDRANPEFKAPWNRILNVPRVYTPEDKAIVSPNSDTPHSLLGMDLRTEPMVLTHTPPTAIRYHRRTAHSFDRTRGGWHEDDERHLLRHDKREEDD